MHELNRCYIEGAPLLIFSTVLILKVFEPNCQEKVTREISSRLLSVSFTLRGPLPSRWAVSGLVTSCSCHKLSNNTIDIAWLNNV